MHRRNHPRACGKYGHMLMSYGIPPGSSPHTRGVQRVVLGLIGRRKDHPCTRGEYLTIGVISRSGFDSFPHTREVHREEQVTSFNHRLIPAHAGNTHTGWKMGKQSWDHPRTRGEYLFSIFRVSVSQGSSPHTRGVQNTQTAHHLGCGIIPAHAGSTLVNQHRNNHYT